MNKIRLHRSKIAPLAVREILKKSGEVPTLVQKSPRLRSRAVTTYFIINLAFSDLLTGIFAIPFKFQAALFQEWFLPNSLCQIVPYAETVSLSVSVFTLTASAVHEFRTVFFPKHGRLNTRSARSLVVLIWLIAALVSLPHGLFHRVYLIEDGDFVIAQKGVTPNLSVPKNQHTPRGTDSTKHPQQEPEGVSVRHPRARNCRPVYADESWWKIYNIYLTIIHYFVPMIILDTAYTMIAIKIWTSTVSAGEESQTLNQNNLNTEISNRKLMYMLMIVVACFSLCWFPLETYLLLNEVRPEINGWKYINVLFFCAHWLAMSNSCLNPIIYGLYNFRSNGSPKYNKYKREYKRVLRRLLCRPVEQNTGETFKFDTECSPVVVQRTWPNPYSCDGTSFYSETFQIASSTSTSVNKNKGHS
ncbi:7 transmembrane receptor [Ancylostoma ceylanicum]|uniref:7 transmembrane receptor n=1 Tax=Ancylostoma ceylanicum TaxID=53326 RepID=A0A0D6LVW4_9BILA|nr:7 transmembrane receptor [Ancylostoma ceylanicum]